MKYKVGCIVVNSAHIICVEYDPASSDNESHVLITTTGTSINPDWDGTIEFSGYNADAFWEVYMRDAYNVVV